jgi:hypothetical protein
MLLGPSHLSRAAEQRKIVDLALPLGAPTARFLTMAVFPGQLTCETSTVQHAKLRCTRSGPLTLLSGHSQVTRAAHLGSGRDCRLDR